MSTPTRGAACALVGVEWTLVYLRQNGGLIGPPDGACDVVLWFTAEGVMSGRDPGEDHTFSPTTPTTPSSAHHSSRTGGFTGDPI